MPKFRRKSVIIEAERVPMDVDQHRDMAAWGHLCGWMGRGPWQITADLGIDLKTPTGTLHAHPGDWIIKNDLGELYPCSPRNFALTYEAVDAESP